MRWVQWTGGPAWAVLALGLALLWLVACAPGEVPSPPSAPTPGEEAPVPSPVATPTEGAVMETPVSPTPGEGAFQSPLAAPEAATEEPKIRAVEPPASAEGPGVVVTPGRAVPGGPPEAPFRTLAQGRSNARLERPLLLVTDTREGLQSLLNLVPDLVVAKDGREVDFSQEVVIAVLYATPQGGAPVTIENLRHEGREVEVLARIPGAGARGPGVAPQQRTSAMGYHIIAFPKASLPRWSEQPLRFALRAVDDGVLTRTIPLGPRDTYLEFDILATGLAEGSGPGRTAVYVAMAAEDLKAFLPYIQDRSHRQVLNSVDWTQDVVVAVFQGRRAGQAQGVYIGAVRRAVDWVVLHATFPRAAGLMLPEVGPYAYQIIRLRKADLPGWEARPYRFFLVGERLQQLTVTEVQAGGKIQPLPGEGGAGSQGQ